MTLAASALDEIDDRHHPQRGVELDRIKNLSDGIFAVAITLLTLDITVPRVAPGTAGPQLAAALLSSDFLTHLWGFVLSFAVVAIFWVSHHRAFRYIRRYDGRLMTLNLVFLFFVAMLPITTALVSAYGDQALAAAIYGANCAALGIVGLLLWSHATADHRLVDADLDARVIRFVRARWLAATGVFLLSIPLTLISPYLAEASWSLLAFATPVMLRRALRARS